MIKWDLGLFIEVLLKCQDFSVASRHTSQDVMDQIDCGITDKHLN